jgi:hypothetical protein
MKKASDFSEALFFVTITIESSGIILKAELLCTK